MKTAGLSLLFLCFSLGGYFAAERLDRRVKTLEKVCAGVARYRELMTLSGREIACILPESFEKTGVTFTGGNAQLPRDIPLDSEEKKMLTAFLSQAGTEDINGETRRCRAYLSAFEQRLQAAREHAREKRRIYLVSGVCCGAAAVVLFI